MPRPNPPPTPGSSSDIRGKEGSMATPAMNLPPTAYQEPDRVSNSASTPSANGSDSSYRPVSPPSPAELSRKRPAGQVVTKDDFALPPPPTRSRKIIQMKPRESEQQGAVPGSAQASSQAAGRSSSSGQSGSKRKQGNAGTAAGRKIARKTAHSLIERRRRSKMNEEFGVLKDMIPACKGQEMHKLAILQASIDYLRYLEQCVADLQAQSKSPQRPPLARRVMSGAREEEVEDDEDEEMEDHDQQSAAATPVTTAHERSGSLISLPSLSQMTSTSTASPSIFNAGGGRHYSISSASQASYSPYFHSNQTSPAFGPQLSHLHSAPPYNTTFGLGSPALKPVDSTQTLKQIAEGATELSEKQRSTRQKAGRSEQELDQEAAAALSMLNNDRRSWRAGGGKQVDVDDTGRSNAGMSVRDLLSG